MFYFPAFFKQKYIKQLNMICLCIWIFILICRICFCVFPITIHLDTLRFYTRLFLFKHQSLKEIHPCGHQTFSRPDRELKIRNAVTVSQNASFSAFLSRMAWICLVVLNKYIKPWVWKIYQMNAHTISFHLVYFPA